jgi:hypothetical protein
MNVQVAILRQHQPSDHSSVRDSILILRSTIQSSLNVPGEGILYFNQRFLHMYCNSGGEIGKNDKRNGRSDSRQDHFLRSKQKIRISSDTTRGYPQGKRLESGRRPLPGERDNQRIRYAVVITPILDIPTPERCSIFGPNTIFATSTKPFIPEHILSILPDIPVQK